ncbi:MAG: nitroreductase [Thermoanaerobaculia bacterium]
MSRPKDPRKAPWRIDETDFFEIESEYGQKEFLLRYAVLAPSGHNTQPWSFRITEYGIEVFADYSRRLPVADPTDRELLISVGAAIANLRVAAAHFGFESAVLYQDQPDESLPVALLTLRETCNPDESLRDLFPSVLQRHTSHAPFKSRGIDPEQLTPLCDFVDAHPEVLRFIVPQERSRAAELVTEADRILMADPKWRGELAAWVRSNEGTATDGICADAFGIPGPISALAPWLIRTLDMGASRAKEDASAIDQATGLIVVTANDERSSLIAAGVTLELLLLLLTGLGMHYSFMNQPIEVPALRQELWSLIRSPRAPQLLLRIGYAATEARPMPRRSVEDVTV